MVETNGSAGAAASETVIKLTAEAVREIALDCVYDEGEDTSDAVVVEGIVRNYGYKPSKLEERKADIAELLAELPPQFQPPPDGGGGWSFLNACMDKHGNQWGEHIDIECLMCLGIATGQAEYNMARDLWDSLPGGMPYFGVKKHEQE